LNQYEDRLQKIENSLIELKNDVASIANNLAELELFQACFQFLKREPWPKNFEHYVPLLKENKMTLQDLYSTVRSWPKYAEVQKTELPTLVKKINDLNRYSQEYESQIKSENPKAICFIDLMKIAYLNLPAIGNRFDEYFWVAKKLETNGKLLDVGCYGHFTQELATIPSLDVYGIDIREQDYKPNFKFFLVDASRTDFGDDFFDQIIAISSIEHFGLEAYDNQNIDENLDLKTMKELYRILKKGGNIFLTFPFGKGNKPTYRKYDEHRLKQLLNGFEIKESKFIRQTHVGWVETSMEDASKQGDSIYLPDFPAAVAMIEAIKPD